MRRLTDAEGATTRLHDHVRGSTLCAFQYLRVDRLGGDGGGPPLPAGLPPGTRHRVVLDHGRPEAAGTGRTVLVDRYRHFARHVRPAHGTVLVVRPDGYVQSRVHPVGESRRASRREVPS